MIPLLPVGLILAAVVVIVILQRARVGAGMLWLIAAVTILCAWGITLALHWIAAVPVESGAFLSSQALSETLAFRIDDLSWPYAFSLISLLLGFILTAPIRFSVDRPHVSWVGAMILTAAAYLAVTSGTIFSVIMIWMLIDILELAILLLTVTRDDLIQAAIVQFSTRLAGIYFAVWGLLVSIEGEQAQVLASTQSGAGLYLLIAAALHLGVFPFHTAYFEEPLLRRGIATIMRLVVPISTLSILSRLPPDAVPPDIAVYILVFTTFTALYGGIRWLAAADELTGRPYLIITVGSLATACAVRGQPAAALAWGTALILAGGFLFLAQVHSRLLRFILLVAWLGVTGLPFTPSAAGWPGLVVLPFNLLDILSIIAHALISIGFVKHGLRQREPIQQNEAWIKATYLIGLFLVSVSLWMASIIGGQSPFSMGIWWAALASLVITLLALAGYRRITSLLSFIPSETTWWVAGSRRAFSLLTNFFSLRWLFNLLSEFYTFFQMNINFITRILEGDGGFLWALVLLALIFSVLRLPGGLR